MEPRFRKGQILKNNKTGKEIIIDSVKKQRKITKNYSGFIDEFIGEYSYVSFDENGTKSHGDISEDILIQYYESSSNK
jgi:hypothetical protein